MADGPGSGSLTTGARLAPSDAVIGWRYWQVAGPRAPVLTSVSYRWSRWPPGQALRAVCRAGGHRAPADTCGCGIYGTVDLLALRDHGLCLGPVPVVVGEVWLWGETVREARELRAEYAAPRRLWLVRETVADSDREQLAARLGDSYRVPVGEMALDEAVGEISAVLFANQVMAREASALHHRFDP